MTTLKEELIYTAETLSDNASLDDVMYKLYVLDRIHQAEVEEQRGATITLEELRKESDKW